MAIEVLTVERAFCPLDLLLFARLKREVPGLLEDTWDRNPGLADLGSFLPIGTKVTVDLPAPVTKRPQSAPRLIRLTD